MIFNREKAKPCENKDICPCRVKFLPHMLHKGCCHWNILPTCSHLPYGTVWQIRRTSLWAVAVVFDDINRPSFVVLNLLCCSSVGPMSHLMPESIVFIVASFFVFEISLHGLACNMCDFSCDALTAFTRTKTENQGGKKPIWETA